MLFVHKQTDPYHIAAAAIELAKRVNEILDETEENPH